jgi:hypothetical protein
MAALVPERGCLSMKITIELDVVTVIWIILILSALALAASQ